jgi:hypothetical protein
MQSAYNGADKFTFGATVMTSSEPRAKAHNATIDPSCCCKTCGWPVIVARCTDDMAEQERYAGHDGWAYCANKTCINHEGTGLLQGRADFAAYTLSPGEDRQQQPKPIGSSDVAKVVLSRRRLPGDEPIQSMEEWAERN